jgi:transcription initiation factor TFIIB
MIKKTADPLFTHSQKQDPIRNCLECKNDEWIKDSETGELICGNCGVVVPFQSIDRGPEWKAFTARQKEKSPRTGAPTNLMMHDKGLSTRIGWEGVDGTGKRMTASQKNEFYRLRKWDQRTRVSESSQRNLVYALSLISARAAWETI